MSTDQDRFNPVYEGRVFLTVRGRSGRKISAVSSFDTGVEKEVLFEPGTRFWVKDAQQKEMENGEQRWYIELEEQ